MFNTDVATVTSGEESRNANWLDSKGVWEIGGDLYTKAETDSLIAFFRERKGRAGGFRFKDWSDFLVTSAQGGFITNPSFPNALQMVKIYTVGSNTTQRLITKPVPGTVTVYLNGMQVTPDVNYTNGLVSVTGAGYTWKGEFDVPVRFSADTFSSTFEGYRDSDGESLLGITGLSVTEIEATATAAEFNLPPITAPALGNVVATPPALTPVPPTPAAPAVQPTSNYTGATGTTPTPVSPTPETPAGSFVGTTSGYTQWGFLVTGIVTGSITGFVSGAVTNAGGTYSVAGYVAINGSGVRTFMGCVIGGADLVEGAVTGSVTNTTTPFRGRTYLLNDRYGYDEYIGWVPTLIAAGSVSSFLEYPVALGGAPIHTPVASITVRLMNFIPSTDGLSLGTQHLELQFEYEGSGGALQLALFVLFHDMPETFNQGGTTLGPFDTVTTPPNSASVAAYREFVLNNKYRTSYPPIEKLFGTFRSYVITSQQQKDEFTALNGATVLTPNAWVNGWGLGLGIGNTTPVIPDEYWDSKPVNLDNTGGTFL